MTDLLVPPDEIERLTRERPILFQGDMVRAILSGSKTQTRRVVKLKGWHTIEERDDGKQWPWMYDSDRDADYWLPCPYGKPGDRLWVREAFSGCHEYDVEKFPPSAWFRLDPLWYWADGNPTSGDWTRPKPSIHMPRWASRITLEITEVRVERLNSISDEDAQAEGTPCYVCGGPMDGRSEDDCHCFHSKAKASDYRDLWERINGSGSWEENPWVWCVSFRRIET